MIEEARPGDAALAKAIYQERVDLKKFFSKGAMENVYLHPEMLFAKMPRDHDNKRYNAMHDIHDKVHFLMELSELHQGEIKEVCGSWDRVATALPHKEDSPAWYTPQYAEGKHCDSVRPFPRRGRQSDGHFVKRSWLSSLRHLVSLGVNLETWKLHKRLGNQGIHRIALCLPFVCDSWHGRHWPTRVSHSTGRHWPTVFFCDVRLWMILSWRHNANCCSTPKW